MSWINSNESEPGLRNGSWHHRRSAQARILWVVLALFLATGAFWMWRQAGRSPRIVHAETCDATALSGTYGYTMNGFFFDNAGNTFFYSAAGAFVADGKGNLTAKETNSVNGTVTQAAPYSGSYTVNTDCSGSLVANYPAFAGNPAFTSTFDFAITDSGLGVQIVETDNLPNVTGIARKQ